ncbi:MAG: hypothetical protein WA717_12870 [Methyloceanibacter sp.]
MRNSVWDLFILYIASYGRLVGVAAMDDDQEVRQLAEDALELPALLRALVMGFAAFRELAHIKELSEREAARHNKNVISSLFATFRH